MPQGNLLEYAIQAEKNLEQLATGLGQEGADEGTIQVVTQMAEMARKLVRAMGKQDSAPKPEAAAPPGGATMQSATEGMAADVRQ